MAAVQNARDVALQATSPRITPVTLPSGFQVDLSNTAQVINNLPSYTRVSGVTPLATQTSLAYGGAYLTGFGALAAQSTVNLASQISGQLANANVAGLGSLALLNSLAAGGPYLTGFGALATANAVNLATQITGQLANANVAGLGALALLASVDLGSGTYTTGNLAANRIAAGSLAVGVVYSGTINTSQINAGTLGVGVVYAGTINTSQINAGTLAAGVVYTGTVAANQVLAGSLASGVIYTGTLNANQLVSGTATYDSNQVAFGLGVEYEPNGHVAGVSGRAYGASKLAGAFVQYNYDGFAVAAASAPGVGSAYVALGGWNSILDTYTSIAYIGLDNIAGKFVNFSTNYEASLGTASYAGRFVGPVTVIGTGAEITTSGPISGQAITGTTLSLSAGLTATTGSFSGAWACNGSTPQTKATVGAALGGGATLADVIAKVNSLQAVLVNNGQAQA